MDETQKLQHFGWLLVDLVGDLTVAAVVYRDYLQHEQVPKDGLMFHGVSRMCKFSVIISLCKLHDALRDNGLAVSKFPAPLLKKVKAFRKYVADNKIFTLRSKFVAHNFDDLSNFSYDDGDQMFSGLLGSTLGENIAFFEYISPFDHDKPNDSMSYFVSALRDHVKTLVDFPPRISRNVHP